MMNQDNPYAMNQTCKVCGEPAAGFHFGAFTCEGCKSFFGRSYNNLSSISDCKNNGECIINKKNRTACKACRLRKCLIVGMSKSGSRYGRRSNWFKIHCLLQEQQQQAAAAMAAHHNSQHHQHQQHQQQQQQQHHAHAAAAAAAAQKSLHGGVPPSSASAAAAAAFGMLGHAGAYPGLYQPRTKEELMMLGLEDYAKHATASPSVSSPDSHNSDSSLEVSVVRGNALMQLTGSSSTSGTAAGGKDANASNAANTTTVGPPPPPPQLRKDLPPFLPLPFPGFPVMPPPAFVPPSHLLFPGYHPALYQHHQGLLKPSPEQQQQAAAAAAAVQHLFNATAPNRFTPPLPGAAAAAAAAAAVAHHSPLSSAFSKTHDKDTSMSPQDSVLSHNSNNNNNNNNNSNNNNNNNNSKQLTNNLPNGSKPHVTDEQTKRFYLDAVLKSQRKSPPPTTTKLPLGHSKHDHSISALVTPNSESGRERLASRQSNAGDEDEDDCHSAAGMHSNDNESDADARDHDEDDDDCGEDLVVSMTPPRSPANAASIVVAQEIPIDLSMKTGNSVTSCAASSKCSSNGSVRAVDSDNEHDENENENENEHGKDNEQNVLEMPKKSMRTRTAASAFQKLEPGNFLAAAAAAAAAAIQAQPSNFIDDDSENVVVDDHVAADKPTIELHEHASAVADDGQVQLDVDDADDDDDDDDDDEDNSTVETIKTTINACNNNNSNINNNNNYNNNSNSNDSSITTTTTTTALATANAATATKRKLEHELPALDVSGAIKRVKLQMDTIEHAASVKHASTPIPATPATVVATTTTPTTATTTTAAPLDLSAKV